MPVRLPAAGGAALGGGAAHLQPAVPRLQHLLRVIPGGPPARPAVAYNFGSKSEACELLWPLAQLDGRPTNQHPEHPLRVLRDLAEFGVSKPIAYIEAIIDIASRWFADGQQLSPFDVLEPILATEGSAQSYSDHTISFRPYALNVEAVLPLRQRHLDLAFAESRSADLRRASPG